MPDPTNTTKQPRAPRRLRATVKGGFNGTTHGIFFDNEGVSRDAVSEDDEAKLKAAFPGVTFSVYSEKPITTETQTGEQDK
jgi:hypothetical protein